MCELKNTIRFSFSNGSEKPNIGEIVAFVKALNADHGEIEAAYRMAEEKSLFIKFKNEESMLHALTVNSDELFFHYASGKASKVHMSHAQECIFYIRIYDLPPEIPDQELELVLGKYGKVKRVVREKFPVELGLDAYTGVRGVYMDVKKEIPTSLHFANRKGNIFYPGNKDKCFLCKEEGHRISSCPKRKVRNHPEKRRQEHIGTSTYAGAVSGGTVIGAPAAVDAVTGEEQSDSSHQESMETLEDLTPGAMMTPTVADISENETNKNEHNHPMYQLASQIAVEIRKRNEEMKQNRPKESRKPEEKEAMIKSPPRKKKNCSLYQK